MRATLVVPALICLFLPCLLSIHHDLMCACPMAPACGALASRKAPQMPFFRANVRVSEQGSMMRLRGGEDGDEEEKEGDCEPDVPATMFERLKINQSTSPADHPSTVEWGLAVALSIYAAMGAPFAAYIPGLSDLVQRKPKEKQLSPEEVARLEREAIRKEQDEEFAQAMMEDKMKAAEKKKKQEAAEAEARAKKEEAQKKSSAVENYTKGIATKKEAMDKEPAQGDGVVMLRIRCPDGTQLTRKFKTEGAVGALYDYVDVARHDKAQNTADPSVHIAELAEFEYQLVSTMPKLVLADRSVTLADAGITTSCALVVQPIAKD